MNESFCLRLPPALADHINMELLPMTYSKSPAKHSMFSFANLYKAYKSCQKGKSNKNSAIKFEIDREKNLLQMSRDLTNRTYKPGTFSCFPITDPKLREVWAADFKDRIIHHLLISKIEPSWEKIFIHHSYACRTRKGAHKATLKIKKIIVCSQNYNQPLFYLHIDIRGFFTNIDKNILFEILSRRNNHPDILYLTKLIVFHNPKSDYVIKGNEKLLRDIPRHKSLFGVPDDKGLPIGNYTSQFFANVYLNELDQYAKRILKCHYYFRYMDDVVILMSDVRILRTIAKSIDNYLKQELNIELHPKKTRLQEVKKGIDFLGYILYPEYSLSRRRVVGNIRAKLAQFHKEVKQLEDLQNINVKYLEEIELIVRKAQQVINSYWGHFKHADCRKLKEKLYDKHFGKLQNYLVKSNKGDHFVIKTGIFPDKKQKSEII